ncbi:MAG TPA: zinc-ribbon domain-containing protein [Candidatus Bathyarchaeia archaeon]|nr:zinc-ribbon domain-containing protein [Candidatus Bathyarchaeia archaeon]
MAKPLLIREGPIGATGASSGDPYWFQQGAFGVSSPVCDTCNSVGASVMIRTVYDSVDNDAHSYWIGAILSNGAFVQVGYLNGLTTTGQYYCCAWFYEFFPPGNTTSPPIIGLIGSAGPIGSWHTYTMNSTSSNVWSFYIDNQYLGSSPDLGNKWNLGSSNTGSNPIAALSEVADTTVRTDTIGPAEFKNMAFAASNPSSFQLVPSGKAHIGCGESPTSCLPNPYGVAEITNRIGNDFLAGSVVAPGASGSDQCGSPTSNNGLLWSTTLGPTCTGTTFSFSFVDQEGGQVTPNWIGLIDSSGTQIFYTNYQAQLLPSPVGQWTIDQVSWHSVNVTTSEVINASTTTQTFLTNIFSVRLTVVGYFYSLPVKNATVIMYLPDSTNQTAKTDNNGEASFTQLPPAAYSLHIQVPYGITSNQVHTLSGPGSVVAKVFSLPELITIIIPPILIAIIASAAVARREHKRQQMMPAQPFLPQPLQPPVPAPMFCRRCGAPLGPAANFCTSCGTPVRMMVQ